jgi:hypothetical protein
LEACPSTINTFLGDAKKAIGITRNGLIVKLRPNDVMENSSFKVKTIVIKAQSYNVLVGAMFSYPMGF